MLDVSLLVKIVSSLQHHAHLVLLAITINYNNAYHALLDVFLVQVLKYVVDVILDIINLRIVVKNVVLIVTHANFQVLNV